MYNNFLITVKFKLKLWEISDHFIWFFFYNGHRYTIYTFEAKIDFFCIVGEFLSESL